MELGKRGARSDFAVRFFHHKNHPKFYKNRPALLRAVRRAINDNFPDPKAAMRQRVIEILGLDRPDAGIPDSGHNNQTALENSLSED